MNTVRRTTVILSLALAIAIAGARDLTAQDPPQAATITLKLADTDIRDALRLVADQGHVNMVISSAVMGTVTLELDHASLEETLDAIVNIGGFEYTMKGDIVTVNTLAELIEKQGQRDAFALAQRIEPPAPTADVLLLKLDYVDAERVLSVIEPLLSEIGSVSILKTPDHVSQAYDDNIDETSDLQIGTRLSTTSHGQPARSHTLVVSDVLERLERIQALVAQIDVKPMQILIEARFVEVGLDEDHKLGIDWNLVAKAAGGATPTTFPFGDSTLGSYDPFVTGGSPGGVFPNAPSSVSTPGTAGLFTFGTLDFTAFTAVLELIQRDSRIKVVSNPRIVVDDRSTATILVGERYPILSTFISDFGTITEQVERYEPIGVQLEVTPSVLSDDEIQLIVRPSTSALGGIVEGSTGLTAARITTRQIDTSVIARDNQTVVLGGLITSREAEVVKKVPLLGDIPLLGRLFSSTATTTQRIDLAIFLTVTMLKDGGLTAAERTMFVDSFPESSDARPSLRTPLEYSPSNPQY